MCVLVDTFQSMQARKQASMLACDCVSLVPTCPLRSISAFLSFFMAMILLVKRSRTMRTCNTAQHSTAQHSKLEILSLKYRMSVHLAYLCCQSTPL